MVFRKFQYMILLFVFLVISCADKPMVHDEHKHREKLSDDSEFWGYAGEKGPEHWAELEPNSECDGLHQSPINISSIESIYDTTYINLLTINYSPETKIKRVINNGYTIKYDFERGDCIKMIDDTFRLLQIHFHEPSEHTIDGIRYPVEMHLVHMNRAKQYIVLGIMAKEGHSSETFDFLESYLPIQPGESKVIDTTFDLNQSLPGKLDFYLYPGSLTTPPCSESVDWLVFKEPITISREQISKLKVLMPLDNYRNEQPIGDRHVLRNFEF